MDTQTEVIKPAPVKKQPISANALKGAAFEVLHHFILIPGEYDYEDILESSFWTHIAPRTKMYSVLTCVSDTGKFDVDLRVVEHTGKAISVRPMRVAKFTDDDKRLYHIAEDAYEVRHIPNKGHGVRNKLSGEWLVQGKSTAAEAKKWLDTWLDSQKKQ